MSIDDTTTAIAPPAVWKFETPFGADAALCASIFHYGHHTIGEAKEFLTEAGIPVRTG